MKHDIVIGNPPFQNNIKRGKTQHKLWAPFTERVFSHWLKPEGYLGWITPQSWGSPNSKILDIFREKDVRCINFDTKHYFPTVASTFSHYVIKNSPSNGPSTITVDGESFLHEINQETIWVPNILSKESISVHSKVMFGDAERHRINYDYVTCHNVIRHAKSLLDKKMMKVVEKLMEDGITELETTSVLERLRSLSEKRAKAKITVSEVRTDEHVHPLLHTNVKTWYSSIEQSFARGRKVMWSRSGYTKPFYNNGTVDPLGCTDMGYFINVDSDKEGENLERFLNSSLMRYIFKTAKWSGFGNERVFMSIPKIALSGNFNDSDVYDSFNLTKEEISHIKETIEPGQRSKSSRLAEGETKSQRRIKEFGEVYTPEELVVNIVNDIPREVWQKPGSTVLDPACGHGNFVLGGIARKIDCGLTPLEALSTTYGCDILEDNVEECRRRIRKLMKNYSIEESLVREVTENNIVQGNSLVDDLFC